MVAGSNPVAPTIYVAMTQYINKYGVIFPAYNVEEHLGKVLEDTSGFIPREDILVVDDGSSDGTFDVAKSAQVVLIRHDVNKGKGEALKTGFSYFIGREDIEAVFTIDADGQHDPSEIPSFIEMYETEGLDIVIGSRMNKTEGMPLVRFLTNKVTSSIISLRAGRRIEDSQSGYRLIKTELLADMQLAASHYDLESEILIRAGLNGAKIGSVPIKTIYGDEHSKINPLRDTARFLMLVFRSFFW